MLFLPNDDKLAAQAKQIVEDVIASEGRCKVAGWRNVPVDHTIVGRMAKATEPRIVQVGCQLALHAGPGQYGQYGRHQQWQSGNRPTRGYCRGRLATAASCTRRCEPPGRIRLRNACRCSQTPQCCLVCWRFSGDIQLMPAKVPPHLLHWLQSNVLTLGTLKTPNRIRLDCPIAQVFIEAKEGTEGDALERELFIVRKLIEKEKAAKMGADAADFYVASLSDKTIVYKVQAPP